MFQTPIRYPFTYRENVALGNLAAAPTDDAIKAATLRGGASDLFAKLPSGLGTWLDPARPGGVDLSGGEWQRVGITRAGMREAPIVVFDEPTAAMDPQTESEVFRRFAEATRERTAVLASHRLGMARLCDRVVVLDAGQIVETGTHADLVARGGVYARMWEMQAAWYR